MKKKTFFIRTAIKKLRQGKIIKVADNHCLLVYKTRKNNTEVWRQVIGYNWTKYGTLKTFASNTYKMEKFEEVLKGELPHEVLGHKSYKDF